MNLSNDAKEMQDYFSGKGGDKYTKRNLNSDENKSAKDIIYNVVKMNKAKSVCEVGCNIGNNLSRLNGLCLSYGIDVNEKALSEGKKKYPFVNFVKGSAYNLPFKDNQFDLVFCRGLLIHIPPHEINRVLSEQKRISKKHIINIEYPVKNENNFIEEIKWRENKNLWRINLKKHWEIFNDVKVKGYFPIDKEQDNEENWICIIKIK